MPTKTATSISIRRPNRPTFPLQYCLREMAARRVAVLSTSETFEVGWTACVYERVRTLLVIAHP